MLKLDVELLGIETTELFVHAVKRTAARVCLLDANAALQLATFYGLRQADRLFGRRRECM